MNRTAQKHLDAIRAGEVTRTNVIGLRKLINAMERKARRYSVRSTQCTVEVADWHLIESELDKCRPIVRGELHESGLALLRSPRYAKRLASVQEILEHATHFRLLRFDRIDNLHCVPVYQVCTGGPSFVFRNIPWQSGGDGPEIQGMKLGTIVDHEGAICLQTSPRVFYPLEGSSGIAHDFREVFNRATPSLIGRELHRVKGVLYIENLEQMRERQKLEGEKA